jgi:hypothetical protein
MTLGIIVPLKSAGFVVLLFEIIDCKSIFFHFSKNTFSEPNNKKGILYNCGIVAIEVENGRIYFKFLRREDIGT